MSRLQHTGCSDLRLQDCCSAWLAEATLVAHLDDAKDVPGTEDVVLLLWSWQEVCRSFLAQGYGCIGNRAFDGLEVIWDLREQLVKLACERGLENALGRCSLMNPSKLAGKTRAYAVSSHGLRCASPNNCHIVNLFPKAALSVIKSLQGTSIPSLT